MLPRPGAPSTKIVRTSNPPRRRYVRAVAGRLRRRTRNNAAPSSPRTDPSEPRPEGPSIAHAQPPEAVSPGPVPLVPAVPVVAPLVPAVPVVGPLVPAVPVVAPSVPAVPVVAPLVPAVPVVTPLVPAVPPLVPPRPVDPAVPPLVPPRPVDPAVPVVP